MTNRGDVLVSVIITNYNYGRYIGEAIESVLNQTYSPIEIIVIDDGSTDTSDDVISRFAKKHKTIKYIKQSNKGVVFARNHGMRKSAGDYILFLDGDDRLPAGYVEILLTDAEEQALDVVYTDYQRFGNENVSSEFPEFDLELIKRQNFVHISALIRRSAIGSTEFDKNLNKLSHEDWDFFLGLALDGAIFAKNSSTKLMYRSHESSRSLQLADTSGDYGRQALKSLKAFLYIIDKYKAKHPGQIDIYSDSEVVKWGSVSLERLSHIADLQQRMSNLNQIISDKDKIIEANNIDILTLREEIIKITNSKKYKIGKLVTTPIAAVKKVLNRGKAHES